MTPATEQTIVSTPRPAIAEDVTGRICAQAAGKSAERLGSHLRALILTGSLARQEGTIVGEGGCWQVRGDAEFLLILNSGVALLPEGDVRSLVSSIEKALLQEGISCAVSIGVCHDRYLRNLRPHIFACELARSGVVVHGEERILSLIPPFAASAIPWEDGWRMLANRMVEQIRLVRQIGRPRRRLSEDAHYQVVKFGLDMATSFLLFAGEYAPSYRERAERLRALASESAGGEWPFDLRNFSQMVDLCMDWKLSPRAGSAAGFDLWQACVEYAEKLWQWELVRLTCSTALEPADALLERWMDRQSAAARLRGWLYVLRREGRERGGAIGAALLHNGWKRSPRYGVYAAASRLFFRLPELIRSGRIDQRPPRPEAREIAAHLPVSIGRRLAKLTWIGLADEIVWSYNRFLVETRS